MSDLLSAASLLMAVTAILYSLWYVELTSALETPVGRKEDNLRNCRKTRRLLVSKALPLVFIAVATSLIFLPDAIRIATQSFKGYVAQIVQNGGYSAVNTAYCVVVLISILLSIYTVDLFIRLLRLWLSLR
jgi:hypothetical protein